MILLISDDSVTCERLQSALLGRPLEQVSTVADLGTLSGDSHPDLVIVDISDATGPSVQLSERIRELLGSNSSIPVAALVDESAAGTSDCTSLRSYDGVIEKPVDSTQVESVLEAAELFADYDAAIETLFELCRRRARDDADVSRDEILAAREAADACLATLRESQDDLSFERLVREN